MFVGEEEKEKEKPRKKKTKRKENNSSFIFTWVVSYIEVFGKKSMQNILLLSLYD